MKPKDLQRDDSSSAASSKSTPFDIREVQLILRKDNYKMSDNELLNKLKTKPPASGMTPQGTNLDPRERVSRL